MYRLVLPALAAAMILFFNGFVSMTLNAAPPNVPPASNPDSDRPRLVVPHADSPYGTNQVLDRIKARDTELMPEMGIKWVRVHFFWDRIEVEPGVFDWEIPDKAMASCVGQGFGILARINTPPGDACVAPHKTIPDPEKFAAFTKIVLERYPGQIHALEVLNEGNTGRWPGVWERAAHLYVPVLKAGYLATKAYNPDILVLSSGIWQHPMYYLEDMYKAGAKDYFDVFNFHYYIEGQAADHGGPLYFDAVRGSLSYLVAYYYDVMKKYGDGDKPIWVTEFGWAVSPEGQNHGVGEALQAEFTVNAVDIFRRSGVVTKIFPFCFYSTDGMAMIHERDTSKKFGPSAGKDYRRKVFYDLRDYAKRYPKWDSTRRDMDLGPEAAERALAIKNPGMDGGVDSWATDSPAGVAWDAERGYTRPGSIKLTTDGHGPTTATQRGLRVEPDRGYEVRGHMKMSGGMANEFYPHGMIEVDFYDKHGRQIAVHAPLSDNRVGKGVSSHYFVSDTFGDWYEVHYPFRAPADAVTADVTFSLRPPNYREPYKPVAGEAWFDDVTVKPFELLRD